LTLFAKYGKVTPHGSVVPSLKEEFMQNGKRLTGAQRVFFEQNGYLHGLPASYAPEDVQRLNAGLEELMKLLRPGEDSKEIREWHESSRFLFEICMNGKILDCVEDLLGPDFFLWGSNFFIKEPHTASTVGWHQDAYYWPLDPHESITVWLAFDDSTVENGAMEVIPGSHRAGLLKHVRRGETDSVLTLECERGQFREDRAVPVTLRAGEASIHDDMLVHGSPPNRSSTRRAGLTIRYSRTNVKCDLSINPHFKAYLCRGVDRFRYNPEGSVPLVPFARLERKHLSVEEAGRDAGKKAGPTR
jgi:ectoine hydroxylase-related dioxygenase (phytanoyl-CoA dioxygenase family)